MFRFGTACSLTAARIATSLCAVVWITGYAGESGLYEITARTVMPNLEENLRYATTREQSCVRLDDLDAWFPILRHPSLEGCHLDDRHRLACANPQVATGTARLDGADGRVDGVLEVKMGGKNMTFFQRIVAVRQRDCDAPQRK